MYLLNYFFLILCFCTAAMPTYARQQKSTKKIEAEKADPKKKKVGVDQSDFMPEANSFGIIFSYGFLYNGLQDTTQKTLQHQLSGAVTYSFDKYWSSYASISASHESYDNKIVRENDSDQFHSLSNMNFGLVYSKMTPMPYVNRSSNTLNIGLPVSEQSQVDKHIAQISLTNFLQSYTWKNFSLFNRINGSYLWNTQKFSIYNNDSLNSDWLVSDSFGVTYQVAAWLGLRTNIRLDAIRFLDSTWSTSFGNNISVFSNLSGLQLYASMINNSYPENERIDLSFYDKYKKLFVMGLTYAF